MTARVLVGGVGNVFLGDDAFGVEVVNRLLARPLPAGVRAVDFGIRAIDLANALAEHDAAILVDAVARGRAPGTLYVLEPATGGDAGPRDPHGLTAGGVLASIPRDRLPRVLRLVGCEPETFGPEGLGHEGLSPRVHAAVDAAADLVLELARELALGGGDHA